MSSTIDVFYDERVLAHDTGVALHEAAPSPWLDAPEEHTEGPSRLAAMASILRSGPIATNLTWHDGRLATEAELHRVHDADYVTGIRELSANGGGWVTGTTRLGAGSYEPLLAAAGTTLEAAAAVMQGRAQMGYALVRPPGHHAQLSRADGYCFFNHAALAADHALQNGAERVLIVDWDVHHGNGTQDIFYSRSDVLSVSVHMNHGAWGPSHPQTGYVEELGTGEGDGYNVNVPLPLGVGNSAYLRVIEEVIEPLAREYRPQAIVLASGQDASAFDPNGRHNVSMAGFYGIGQRMAALAGAYSRGA